MDNEELKALSFVRKAILKKNEKIRDLMKKLKAAEEKIDSLSSYQWRCATLEEEVINLRNGSQNNGEIPLSERISDAIDVTSISSEEERDAIKVESHVELVAGAGSKRSTRQNDAEEFNMNATTCSNDIFVEPVLGVTDSQESDEYEDDSSGYIVPASTLFNIAASTSKYQPEDDIAPSRRQTRNSSRKPPGKVNPDLEKSHGCPLCNKMFKRKHHLTCHMRVHTGERPFHCPHCDHRSARSDHLRRHVLMKHLHHHRYFLKSEGEVANTDYSANT